MEQNLSGSGQIGIPIYVYFVCSAVCGIYSRVRRRLKKATPAGTFIKKQVIFIPSDFSVMSRVNRVLRRKSKHVEVHIINNSIMFYSPLSMTVQSLGILVVLNSGKFISPESMTAPD
jgi:hypothetical protein